MKHNFHLLTPQISATAIVLLLFVSPYGRIPAQIPVLEKPAASGLPAPLPSVPNSGMRSTVTPVLHTYVNLIQIPVLLVDPSFHPVPSLTRDRFHITIDAGTPFLPRHVRPEGDDPIRLSILLDASGGTLELLPHLEDALTALLGSLNPTDRVSLAQLSGCNISMTPPRPPGAAKLSRVLQEFRQVRTASLQNGRNLPAGQAGKENPRGERTCAQKPLLWDTVAYELRRMDADPGRKILLILSDGIDGESRNDWHHLFPLATSHSIAIVAIRNSRNLPGTSHRILGFRLPMAPPRDPLEALAAGTGGILLRAAPPSLPETAGLFVAMVRGRYIVEFPRPAGLEAGDHILRIRSDLRNLYLSSAGVVVPMPGREELMDPSLQLLSPPPPGSTSSSETVPEPPPSSASGTHP